MLKYQRQFFIYISVMIVMATSLSWVVWNQLSRGDKISPQPVSEDIFGYTSPMSKFPREKLNTIPVLANYDGDVDAPEGYFNIGSGKAEQKYGWDVPEYSRCPSRMAALARDGENTTLSSDCAVVQDFDSHYGWPYFFSDGPVIRSGVFSKTHLSRQFSPDDETVVPIIPESAAYSRREWSEADKKMYENDARNLISVSTSERELRGGRTPSSWMPESERSRCEYARRYIDMSAEYAIPLTRSEVVKLEGALKTCTDLS